MVLLAVEASAVSSGRPCGVYMFSGLTTLVINIYNITKGKAGTLTYAMFKLHYYDRSIYLQVLLNRLISFGKKKLFSYNISCTCKG